MKKKISLSVLSVLLAVTSLYAQTPQDYASLYNNNEYQKSYEQITLKLNELYSARVEDRRIPSGYIALSNIREDTDLLSIFRKRKEKGFFIEDNSEIADLHLFAGRCCFKLNRKKDSLNHYLQSLRFRKIDPVRDDIVFYEIAQVFRTYKEPAFFKGYIDALDQAYTMNPVKYQYSHEIGNALFTTREKKKAIFHLKRYLENTEEEIKPDVYLKLGNLCEGIEDYIGTEKYYNEYLKMKPDDAEILFGLGQIAYVRTGNYILAESSLKRAVKILKEQDIYRRSKSYEYLGDMSFNNLKYENALLLYTECLNYQAKTAELISAKNSEKSEINRKINKLKDSLINSKEFEKYEDYEILVDEKNKIEKDIENLQLEYNKIQPGRLRWFIAVSNEKIQKYDEAIKYYRESIRYDYNSNSAREMIVKLQLKIKRGY